MIRPADWHLMEWAARAPPKRAATSARFVVRHAPNAWNVERDGAVYGAFKSFDDATSHACKLARYQARCGIMSIVMVETEPHELHCFMRTASARLETEDRALTE